MISSNPTYDDVLESMAEGYHLPSDFIGDPLNELIDDQTTRIYVQNLNGLNWDKDGGRWPYICEVMEAIQTDIACFPTLQISLVGTW